jgi:NADH-quinone oxidoreductase subunit G
VAAGARVTEPLLRDGGELRPVPWERALEEAAAGLSRAGARTGALVGGEVTNEEGYLLARLMREGLDSPHIDSRRRAGALPLDLHRALNDPRLQARVSDLEFAHAVLVLEADPMQDAPILDLRLRKGVRRHGMRLYQASAADLLGGGERFSELVEQLRDGPPRQDGEVQEIVILWHERLAAGPDGTAAAQALLDLADTLSLADTVGAGLLEIPDGANGRGLREAGVLPNAGPGLSDLPGGDGSFDAHGIARGLAEGELAAVLLLQADPLRPERQSAADALPTRDESTNGGGPPSDHASITARRPPYPDTELWEQGLERASTVIAHATFLTDGLREHANVVFPAQAYAEKEGTIVHPDGRIQRLRPAVANPGSTRAQWQVIADLATGIGLDLEVLTGAMASQQLFDAVPFYAGLTLEEIGGKGIRWQERSAAEAYPGREQLV